MWYNKSCLHNIPELVDEKQHRMIYKPCHQDISKINSKRIVHKRPIFLVYITATAILTNINIHFIERCIPPISLSIIPILTFCIQGKCHILKLTLPCMKTCLALITLCDFLFKCLLIPHQCFILFFQL